MFYLWNFGVNNGLSFIILQKYVYWGILFIKLAAIRNRILVNYFHYFSLWRHWKVSRRGLHSRREIFHSFIILLSRRDRAAWIYFPVFRFTPRVKTFRNSVNTAWNFHLTVWSFKYTRRDREKNSLFGVKSISPLFAWRVTYGDSMTKGKGFLGCYGTHFVLAPKIVCELNHWLNSNKLATM